MDNSKKPSVFHYLSYRAFLTDVWIFKKSQKDFSVIKFQKKSGLGSPSYLKMVLDGKRNLSVGTAQKVARGFEMLSAESEYFCRLVEFEECKDMVQKNKIFQDLKKLRRFVEHQAVILDQYEYFNRWYISAILVGLSTEWRRKTSKSMATSLGISEQEVSDALDVLQRLGLAEKSHGHWKAKSGAIRTPREMESLNLRNYHREMILKAADSIDKVAREDREIGALTISINKKDLSEIKHRITEFRRELSAMYAESTSGDAIYQLTVQLFPLIDGI